jgi:hypothetical protein
MLFLLNHLSYVCTLNKYMGHIYEQNLLTAYSKKIPSAFGFRNIQDLFYCDL